MQGYHNIAYACHVCGISALGIASTHIQLCITDYKYRKAAGKAAALSWHENIPGHSIRIVILKSNCIAIFGYFNGIGLNRLKCI